MAKKFKAIPVVPFELLIKGHQGVNKDHEKYGSAEPTVSIVMDCLLTNSSTKSRATLFCITV